MRCGQGPPPLGAAAEQETSRDLPFRDGGAPVPTPEGFRAETQGLPFRWAPHHGGGAGPAPGLPLAPGRAAAASGARGG